MSDESKPANTFRVFVYCVLAFIVGNRLGYSAGLEKGSTSAAPASSGAR